MVRIIALACSVAALTLVSPPPDAVSVRAALDRFPALTLWAWERPEDLRDLPDDVGVAFLAQTLTIRGARIDTALRRQPLRVAPATPLIAVTRIEVPPAARISLDAAGVDAVAQSIAGTMALPRVAGVQIDFDATASQRAFYRQLLHRVRSGIGAETPLSITALASWCMDDDWMGGLPVDEAVPMLFRMGADWPQARRAGAAARVRGSHCGGALGLSLDEPLRVHPGGRRVYVFNPHPWTATSLALARRQVSR